MGLVADLVSALGRILFLYRYCRSRATHFDHRCLPRWTGGADFIYGDEIEGLTIPSLIRRMGAPLLLWAS